MTTVASLLADGSGRRRERLTWPAERCLGESLSLLVGLRRYFDATSSTANGELTRPHLPRHVAHVLTYSSGMSPCSQVVCRSRCPRSVSVPPRPPTPRQVPRAASAPCHAARYAAVFRALASGDGVTPQRALGGRIVARLSHTDSARSMLTLCSACRRTMRGRILESKNKAHIGVGSARRACDSPAGRGCAREVVARDRGCCVCSRGCSARMAPRGCGAVFSGSGAHVGPCRPSPLLGMQYMMSMGPVPVEISVIVGRLSHRTPRRDVRRVAGTSSRLATLV